MTLVQVTGNSLFFNAALQAVLWMGAQSSLSHASSMERGHGMPPAVD